jgi:hypothetical protein
MLRTTSLATSPSASLARRHQIDRDGHRADARGGSGHIEPLLSTLFSSGWDAPFPHFVTAVVTAVVPHFLQSASRG